MILFLPSDCDKWLHRAGWKYSTALQWFIRLRMLKGHCYFIVLLFTVISWVFFSILCQDFFSRVKIFQVHKYYVQSLYLNYWKGLLSISPNPLPEYPTPLLNYFDHFGKLHSSNFIKHFLLLLIFLYSQHFYCPWL